MDNTMRLRHQVVQFGRRQTDFRNVRELFAMSTDIARESLPRSGLKRKQHMRLSDAMSVFHILTPTKPTDFECFSRFSLIWDSMIHPIGRTRLLTPAVYLML
jgi:hypothetical protein